MISVHRSPPNVGRVTSPLLDRGAGGRSSGFPYLQPAEVRERKNRIGTAMSDHKFRIGQTVTYRPAERGADARQGLYIILARLPQGGNGQFEYRIKHSSEPYERTAKENELRGSLTI
jgi:hypothetical protein